MYTDVGNETADERRLTQMRMERTTDSHGWTRIREKIIYKCHAVRYAGLDRWTPGYTNEFAYQGVSRSVRPADAGLRSMRG
jgi:predicted double-glycine peptidase